MQAIILQCKPRARFHFGSVAPDNNTSLNATSPWLPSDTLFSALVNIHAEMHTRVETDRFVEQFKDWNTGANLSSGFYCLETNGKWIFFLPKPAHYALWVKDDFKTFNKVQLISQTVWENGWPFETWKEHCVFLQNGKAVAAKSDFDGIIDPEKAQKLRLYDELDSPRVKIHTPTREDAYFQLGSIAIADNCALLPGSKVHLYFLLETNSAGTFGDELRTAVRMLPDRGVGGERSAGCGNFTGIREDVPFIAPKIGQNRYCSVSLTLPAPADLADFSCYQVETRGGRQYGGEDKKFDYVRMLSEGAVSGRRTPGRLVRIGTNEGHEVQRCGRPLYLETHHIEAEK